MKNKTLFIIASCAILLCCICLAYQEFYLSYYKSSSNTNEVIITDPMLITNDKIKSETYLTFNNIKIAHDFNEVKTEIFKSNYIIYNISENKNESGEIIISQDSDLMTLLQTDYFDNFYHENNVTIEDIREFFLDHQIQTDLELFKYLNSHKDSNINIFSSVKEMKENYIINYIKETIFINPVTIIPLEGKHNGYIFQVGEEYYEANIIKDHERYTILFRGEYFTETIVNKYLNSVTID